MAINKYPGKIKHHDTMWALDMSKPELINNFTASGVEHLSQALSPWDCNCLHFTASGTDKYARYTNRSVLDPIQTANGRTVYVRYTAKANNFTGTLRCNFAYTSILEGDNTSSGRYDSATTGTYDWTEFIQSITLPSDAILTLLYVGMTSGSGEVWIRDIRITSLHSSGYEIPTIDPTYVPPAHNIRGFNIEEFSINTFPQDYYRLRTRYNCNLLRVMIYDSIVNTDLTNMNNYDIMFNNDIALIDKHIELAKQNNMKVLIDCHAPPGGRGTDSSVGFPTEYNEIWYKKFIENWKYLANRYKNNEVVWGFDIVNEPDYMWQSTHKQGPLDMNWWKLVHDAIFEIRKIDPTRICVVEHDGYSAVSRYPFLEPFPFDNIVYSPHFYEPSPYNTSSNNDGHLVYPGCVGSKPGTVANKEYLRSLLQPARDFQLRYKVPILVGEFAVMRYAGGAATYLEDLVSIFDEYNWMYTYFIYSEWPDVNVEMLSQASPNTRVDTILDRGQVLIDSMANNIDLYSPTEQAPIAPTLTTTDPSTTALIASWNKPVCLTESFLLSWKESSAGSWSTQSIMPYDNSFKVENLLPLTNYDLKVSLNNKHGSASSPTYSFNKSVIYPTTNVSATPYRAFSLRKIVSTYSGPLIRVRRSSDNAEQDIGIINTISLNMNDLDVSALLSFCGSSSGYVTKWYDQSGSNRDISQSDITRQPRIVNSGVVDSAGTYPAILFNGAHCLFSTENTNMYNVGGMSIVGVTRNLSASGGLTVAGFFNSASSTTQYQLSSGGFRTEELKMTTVDNSNVTGINAGGGNQIYSYTNGTTRQFSARDNHSLVAFASSYNTTGITETYTGTIGTITLDVFSVGARYRGSGSLFTQSIQLLQELFIFDSYINDNNVGIIRNNQMTYYKL